MKKLLSIVVLGLLLSGNAYANKEIIKYGVTQVNIQTGDLYKGERATYGFALDDGLRFFLIKLIPLLIPPVAVSFVLARKMYNIEDIPEDLYDLELIPRENPDDVLIQNGQVRTIIRYIIASSFLILVVTIKKYGKK